MISIDERIAALVPQRSFVDIGGLWGTRNEKVTVAMLSGAARATMVDQAAAGSPLWGAFEAHAANRGVDNHSSVVADLNDPGLIQLIGRFEIVHCSGVIYHCPDPYLSMRQLARIATRHVLIGSMTVPEHIENAEGALDFSGGQAIAVPALRGRARAILARHFSERGLVVHNITSAESFPWSVGTAPNYDPWWWLWSVGTLAGMAEAVGLRVVETLDVWSGNAHYLVCEVPG